MKVNGRLELTDGGYIDNMGCPTGDTFPSAQEAELFCLKGHNTLPDGLYLYLNGEWDTVGAAGRTIEHQVILLNASSSPVAYVLPDVAEVTTITVKRVDNSASMTVSIHPISGTIEGDAYLYLYPYESITLHSDGSNWYVI